MKMNVKKWLRRSLKVLGGLLLLLVILALTIPYFFKDEILAKVKTTANDYVNAEVNFSDVGLSLLWSFPDFSLSIDSLRITGKEAFEGVDLVRADQVAIDIDLWSVLFGDEYTVNEISLDKPRIYVKILNNGMANYDIALPSTDSTATEKETSSTEDSTAFALSLKRYSITNGHIIYDDAPGGIYFEADKLNHEGSGDLSEVIYELQTETTAEQVTLAYEGISYLNKAVADLKMDLKIDMDKMRFDLLENTIRFNALELDLDGYVALPDEETTEMDLTFETPNTSFASLLSMIPAAYTADFSDVKTEGTFNLKGFVKGKMRGDDIPAFELNLGVKNASFQYPDLPLPMKNIAIQTNINSPSSDLDKLVVDVSTFQFSLDGNPFNMQLLLKTPMSDPSIKTQAKGQLDLEKLKKAFPMEEVQELSGKIELDVQADTRLSYVEKEQYDKVKMQGRMGIANLKYNAVAQPPVLLRDMRLFFSPNNVNLENLDMRLGRSDIVATGKLDNILTYFSKEKVMTGYLAVKSTLLDLNEWDSESEEAETSSEGEEMPEVRDTTSSTEQEIFDRFNFAVDIEMDKIVYGDYIILDTKSKGGFTPKHAILDNFQTKIGNIDLKADGELRDIFAYLFDEGILKGRLNLRSNYMNLNAFMSEDGEAVEPETETAPENPEEAESELEPIVIPDNIDFRLTASMARLIYDVYDLRNVKARMHIHNGIADIEELSADAFDGRVALRGKYDSREPKHPKVAFAYDLRSMSFQKISKAASFLQYYLPIAKALDGRFNSSFDLETELLPNLYPDLSKLFVKGQLETVNTKLNSFGPLNTLSEKLNVKALQEVVLKNTVNFFEIKDGKMNFKPMIYSFKGMDVMIDGAHSLTELNYNFKFRVPRELIGKNAAGAAALQGMDAVQKQANQLGLNIEQSEYLDFGVDLGGALKDPKFGKVKLLGVEGKDGQSVGEQVKENLKAKADSLKQEAETRAREEADKLKQQAEDRARQEAQRLKEEAERRAREEAERRLREEAAKKAEEEANKLKDKLKDKIPNPFKNKDKK